MIPVCRTNRPEAAANLLLKTFPHVLVQAHYDNLDAQRIRFRADLVKDERVFFSKAQSQITRWRERGGLLISYRRVDGMEGASDAILFAECPKSIEEVYRAASFTRALAVIYEPPTWRVHEETLARRHLLANPAKIARHMKRLTIVRDYVEALPVLNRVYLERRSRAVLAQSRPSFAPAPSAGAAPASHTIR